MEINFNHGDALELADQAFLFKRTLRQAALKHGIYATFMAKPMEAEPGSSMHIHLSLYDVEGGQNLFAAPDGAGHTPLFLNFIGGLQEYLPAAMPFMAPNVNSYRRLRRHSTAPINVHWGLENRTVGLRVPASRPEARRVENRLAVPTPTPISRSRPRSPAAGSASPAGSSPPTRSRAAPTAWPRPCRSRCPRRCAS
jgi:glutamine synthetase